MNKLFALSRYAKSLFKHLFIIIGIGVLFHIITLGWSQMDGIYRFEESVILILVVAQSYFITLVVLKKYRQSKRFVRFVFLKIVLLSTLTVIVLTIIELPILFLKQNLANAALFTKMCYFICLISIPVHFLILGALLSYHSSKSANQATIKLLKTEKELNASAVKLMQQQLDPHFLFNNLNVLSNLIHTNKELADVFLHKFSSLYRYILQNKQRDIIGMDEELNFIQDYLFLIQQRFPGNYIIHETFPKTLKLQEIMVVPCSFQLLIENVVKHNEASQQNPIHITVEIDNKHIAISNTNKPKTNLVESNQYGLQQLKNRYRLLTNIPVEIIENDQLFIVSLPIINMH